MDIKNKVSTIVKYSSIYLDNSNATEERNTDNFHVEMLEEVEIKNKILENFKVIILTGEAGEGKTHLIRRLNKQADYKIIEDFSALSLDDKKDLINKLDLISQKKSNEKFIIAANVGIFVRTILRERPILLDKIRNNVEIFFKINFENRNLAGDKTKFYELVQTFLIYDNKKCSDKTCVKYNDCPFEKNIIDLQNQIVIENIRILCNAIFLKGGHITLRELLSLLATLVTFGLDCNMVKNMKDDEMESIRYYNIFDKNDGIILDKIAQLDPSKKSSEDDFTLFNSLKDVVKFKYKKRQNFFESDDTNLQYKKLPVPYLNEFRKILLNINKKPYYFDVTESGTEYDILKDGLAKLISPNQTNLQITFFDMPKPINKRIKTQFSIDFNDLTMVWNHPEWNPDMVDNEIIMLNSNINYFCLSGCYENDNCNIDYFPLKINFDLYQQIRRAKDNYFLPFAFSTLNKYGLSEFFIRILNTNPKYSEKLIINFEPIDNLINFEMSFYTKNKLLKKNSEKQVVIKKV